MSKQVRVKILAPIARGGAVFRPLKDQNGRITPIEATIDTAWADAAGPTRVQILAEIPDEDAAPAPAAKAGTAKK